MKPVKTRLITDQAHRICGLLRDAVHTPVKALKAEYARSDEPVPFCERLSLPYSPILPGEVWSVKNFDCAWFRISGDVAYDPSYCLAVDLDGEGCIYDKNGVPVRGVTNVSSQFDRNLGFPGKKYVPFTENVFSFDPFEVWIDAASNDLFGEFHSGKLLQCEIVKRNEPLRRLYYDYRFLLDLAESLDDGSPQKFSILYALEKAGFLCSADMDDAAVEAARAVIAPELARKNGDTLLTLYAVGHSHLDLAWLWPVRETKRKAARTFSTQLCYIARYPGYVYNASQPQQFEWIKTEHPALYARVKEAVKTGAIEPQGGMWVEADTNLSGGESLIRQFLYGKRFFKEEFGKETDILWLPDVFGFSGALPQIMRHCGVDKFLTIKLSWNDINTFPYHSFRWQGIDGSEVLVHMPPEGTYNSSAAPHALLTAQREYSERGISENAMMLYGIGDGGAGPGDSHLECRQRSENMLSLPKTENAPSEVFFAKLEKEKDKLPVYKGEMYLERHQGTYTSQGRNKRFNRKTENALAAAEFLCTAAGVWPKEKLDGIWKETLLYQFHDILPGSSIARVYSESEERYRVMLEELSVLQKEALGALGKETVAANPTSFGRKELVRVGENWYEAKVGSYAVSPLAPAEYTAPSAEGNVLENENLRAVFSEDGTLESLFDKKNKREALRGGSNALHVYNDVGDCWDMYINYGEQMPERFVPSDSRTFTDGPDAKRITTFRYGKSVITQTATLRAGSEMLDFEYEVDWQETNRMLRAEIFPLVFTDEAVCDIQFGSVRRSVKRNNSVESAQFEVCAHKWVDFSEPGYGVALINDCKYGHSVKDGKISLNLLRSQNYPCQGEDLGAHTFRYAVYPHAGNTEECDVRKLAYCYNRPLIVGKGGTKDPLITVSDERIVAECVKRAENGKGTVARLYNDSPCPRTVRVEFGKSAFLATGMEDAVAPCDTERLTFRPYEIKTLLSEDRA